MPSRLPTRSSWQAARQIELAHALKKQCTAARQVRRQVSIARWRDRQATRLSRHQAGEREQILALGRQRRGQLMAGAAQVDALRQIDGALFELVPGGIARRHAAHAHRCLRVAGFTRLLAWPFGSTPQAVALLDPQRGQG